MTDKPTITYAGDINEKEEPSKVSVDLGLSMELQNVPRRRLPMTPIPPNSHFNELLIDVSRQIHKLDLEIIKFYYKDELKKTVFQKIDSAIELLRILEERRYIYPENLTSLSKVAMLIEDRDRRLQLIDRIAKYSMEHSTVFFRPNTDIPATGFERVKFHVIGVDRFFVEDVQKLIKTVSALTGADLSEILVDGIQPTSSIDVTFLLKKADFQLLFKLVKDGTHNLGSLMVDMVTFKDEENGQQKFPIDVSSGSKPDHDVNKIGESTEETIQRLNGVVAELQIRNLDYKNEVENMRRELNNKRSLGKTRCVTITTTSTLTKPILKKVCCSKALTAYE